MKSLILILGLLGITGCHDSQYAVRKLKSEDVFMCARLSLFTGLLIPQKFCTTKEECIEHCNHLMEKEYGNGK